MKHISIREILEIEREASLAGIIGAIILTSATLGIHYLSQIDSTKKTSN